MNPSLFTGLIVFSAVAAFTPGPNNLIALASGATRGIRGTLPHVGGVALGFAVMISLVGAGLGSLFEAYPRIYELLKYAAFAYLLYLAWHIARSRGFGNDENPAKGVSVLGSAVFQWVNPKAWFASITVVSTFTEPDRFVQSLAIAALTNVLLAFCAVSTWAAFGTVVKAWLSKPARLRAFNYTMAILLVLSVLPGMFH